MSTRAAPSPSASQLPAPKASPYSYLLSPSSRHEIPHPATSASLQIQVPLILLESTPLISLSCRRLPCSAPCPSHPLPSGACVC
uniref:Uncharacterized protein n=1 Tax=Arundo donax TaxID=35708 RepID=A0A0A9GNT7_ARUDO